MKGKKVLVNKKKIIRRSSRAINSEVRSVCNIIDYNTERMKIMFLTSRILPIALQSLLINHINHSAFQLMTDSLTLLVHDFE